MARTALFGGSFNPPHVAHQMLVLYALEALGFDEVWVIPCHTHPLGKQNVSFEHRVAMCEAMIESFGPRSRALPIERELAEQGSQGRTFALVEALQAQHPDRMFTLLLGSDIQQELHAWHRWDDIAARVDVCFIPRAGHDLGSRDTVPVALPEVSSTSIRQKLASGQSTYGHLPARVEDYIRAHALYA